MFKIAFIFNLLNVRAIRVITSYTFIGMLGSYSMEISCDFFMTNKVLKCAIWRNISIQNIMQWNGIVIEYFKRGFRLQKPLNLHKKETKYFKEYNLCLVDAAIFIVGLKCRLSQGWQIKRNFAIFYFKYACIII